MVMEVPLPPTHVQVMPTTGKVITLSQSDAPELPSRNKPLSGEIDFTTWTKRDLNLDVNLIWYEFHVE